MKKLLNGVSTLISITFIIVFFYFLGFISTMLKGNNTGKAVSQTQGAAVNVVQNK